MIQGGDDSISRTFNMAGDITKDIGDFTGKIPIIGSVTKPIFDVFSDVGNGISKAFSWLGLGSHINQIEDHLDLKPLTEEEMEFYDTIEDGEEAFHDYLHRVGSSHHGGNISNVLGFVENAFKKYNNTNFERIPLVGNRINESKGTTKDIQDTARVLKKVAQWFGLGQNIHNIKAGLGIPDKQPLLDYYYGKEYDTKEIQDIVNNNNDDEKDIVIESVDGGKYIIDGGKYIIESRNGGKYIIEKAGKYIVEGGNDNDPDKWIIGNGKHTNKKKKSDKEKKYLHKLVLRAKRINHVINKNKK